MANTPLISIGIPFRDPGLLLIDAVKSVFAQTIDDWELILVNDGSKDESVELAARIMDRRVRFVNDGRCMGLVSRLNQIIDLSRGKYIARMDADDLMHPDRLRTQLFYMERQPNIQVSDTGAVVLNTNRQPVGTRGLGEKRSWNAVEMLKWGVVLHPSVMARRDWYRSHRYDQRYPRAEDRELFIRAFDPNMIIHISEPLYFYMFAGNIRKNAFLQGYRSERRVLLRYGPRLVGWPKTGMLWIRSLAKTIALPILLSLGCERYVTRNSYDPIDLGLLQESTNVLQKIRQQPVPGW